MALELRHLRYFVAVAQEGHVTRAAQRLYVSQPALSQALRELERQIGVPLLERHSRGVSLTPAGEQLFAKATIVLEVADDAVEAARRAASGHGGELRVGFLPASLGTPARACLAVFRAARPDVHLRMKQLSFATMEEAVRRNAVDVVAGFLPITDPAIGYLPFAVEPRCVGLSERHPLADAPALTVDDLLGEPCPGFHPATPQAFIAFTTLEKERGEPAAWTDDEITTPEEAAAVIVESRSFLLAPASHAAQHRPPGLAWRPVIDAQPLQQAITYLKANHNPLVRTLKDLTQQRLSITNDGARITQAHISPVAPTSLS